MNDSWSIVGKVAMVTGANTGIGKFTVLELARRGAAKVILVCRCMQRATEAVRDIEAMIGPTTRCDLQIGIVDLSSFNSVRKLAAEVIETEENLDVLVNNAGFLQRHRLFERTEDGFEITFQTNFLGPFLLTDLLLDLMKKSEYARIVNVSSQAYQAAFPRGLDVDDVNQEAFMRKNGGHFSYWRAYSQSKLAILLWTRFLHQKLADELGPGHISVFTLHPGEIRTEITRRHRINFIKVWLKFLGTDLVNGGADVPVHCACEPGIEKFSGMYFDKNCKVAKVFKLAKDDEKAEMLCMKASQWTREFDH